MSGKRILLVEPYSRTSYPPLGLMKFATYHKLKGNEVHHVVGQNRAAASQKWDHIYITSVFTYDFEKLINAIHFYTDNLFNINNTMVGGVAATLMADEVEKRTGIKPHVGLQDRPDDFLKTIAEKDSRFGYLKECVPNIDNLPPDYSIFSESTKYDKILENAYFFFTTKGCPNKCKFCAVSTLEPSFVDYIPIKPRIEYIAKEFGERQGLLLLDNNIAASPSYHRILDEIIDCGFGIDGDKMSYVSKNRTIYRKRYVDFNQGVDLRLMTPDKMAKMGKIAINPLRLAFDDISLKDKYIEKMRLALDCEIRNLSNYMLYNFKDTPNDLYERMMINTHLKGDDKDIKIFSFPMRYSPIGQTDRKYVGKNWLKRQVRAIQLVLNATHGIVSHQNKFFFHAFGRDEAEYNRIILYPANYIVNRVHHEVVTKQIPDLDAALNKLTPAQLDELKEMIGDGKMDVMPKTKSQRLRNVLDHYVDENSLTLKSQKVKKSDDQHVLPNSGLA